MPPRHPLPSIYWFTPGGLRAQGQALISWGGRSDWDADTSGLLARPGGRQEDKDKEPRRVDKRNHISCKAALLDRLAPSSALIIPDSLCSLGVPSHLGTLRDSDCILAAIICGENNNLPLVNLKFMRKLNICKKTKSFKLYTGRKLFTSIFWSRGQE